jgi:hypothetical protein
MLRLPQSGHDRTPGALPFAFRIAEPAMPADLEPGGVPEPVPVSERGHVAGRLVNSWRLGSHRAPPADQNSVTRCCMTCTRCPGQRCACRAAATRGRPPVNALPQVQHLPLPARLTTARSTGAVSPCRAVLSRIIGADLSGVIAWESRPLPPRGGFPLSGVSRFRRRAGAVGRSARAAFDRTG